MLFRNFIHTFRRFALASVLNITGLTVAFASFFVIMTQVDYDLNFNKGIPDNDRIVRVNNRLTMDGNEAVWICRPMAEAIVTSSSHISGYSILCGWSTTSDIENEDGARFSSIELRKGFGNFLDLFSVQMVAGSSQCLPDQVMIPESLALKLYGTPNCVGRNIYYGSKSESQPAAIAGVFRDLPANSTFGNVIYSVLREDFDKDNWSQSNYNVYVRLDDMANLDVFKKNAIDASIKNFPWELSEDDLNNPALKDFITTTTLSEEHFTELGNFSPANRTTVWLLIITSIVIIIVATINYMNFNLGETPMRIRSINTQKVLGASVGQLRRSLVGESILVSLVAFALSAVVVGIVRNFALDDLVEGDISPLAHPLLALATFGLSVVSGLLAGLYPAYYATGIAPAVALKGSFGLGKSGRTLRTALVCLQFAVAFMLIICIGIMYAQSQHIRKSSYGYDKDAILVGEISQTLAMKSETVVSELRGLSCVEAASTSQFIISTSDFYQQWGRGEGEYSMSYFCLPVDKHYVETMGIEVYEGRDFNDSDVQNGAMIFNEAAVKAYPFLRLGEKPIGVDNMTVVGFCRDFRYRTFRSDRQEAPMAICVYPPEWNATFSRLNVRIAKGVDKVDALKAVEAKLTEINGFDFDFKLCYMDEAIQGSYARENRFNEQMIVFAIIAIIIGVVGVFGMTMFESEYRRREIGVRKVMGSTTGEILGLFCRRYAWLLVGSFAAGAPLGYLLCQTWLQGFADKVDISPIVFVISFVAISAVTMLTVVIQAWNVANSNPADAVRAS